MNKKIIKSIIASTLVVIAACGVFLSLPVSAAPAPPSYNPSEPVIIPVTYERVKPTMGTTNGTGCTKDYPTEINPSCDVAKSGTAVYHYVGGAPTATTVNIPTVTVKDETTNTSASTKNFIISNGSIYVYGLTKGHSYDITFTYDDAKSKDIVSLVGQVKQYCTNLDTNSATDAAYNIGHNYQSGCNVYNKSPFLPSPKTGVQATSTPFTYQGKQMTLAVVNVKSTATNPSNDDNNGGQEDCPIGDEPLRWASCGLITLGQNAASAMDATVQQFLYTPIDQIFSPQMKTAWDSFTKLGVGLILIAGLVMVVSQALGMEIFDAYTVRKVLPRILIVAIGMALSWPILHFVVTFFNDLGLWAHDLILAPFPQSANISGAMVLGVTAGGTMALGAYALATMSTGGTVALLGTIILAALIGLLVLAVRQLAILVCVLFAPLAIACYILPGTQKIWQFWKDTLLTALSMFPIIMAFIAAGKAFAYLAGSTDSTEMHLLAILVYFAPYFLLPFAFKLAGGLMATVFSIANDKSRGLFDRSKKYRQQKAAETWQRTKSNNRFAGATPTNLRGKINRGLASTANAPSAISSSGALVNPSRWRTAVRASLQNHKLAEIDQNMKENAAYHPWMNDDGLNKAASRTNNANELRDYLVNNMGYESGSRDLEDTVNKVETVRRSMSADAFKAMTTRQALAGGTAYKSNGPIKTAAGEAWADVARATVDDEAMAASLVANGRNDGMKSGRIDYAGAGFGTTMGVVNEMRRELKSTGTISQATIENATRRIHSDVYAQQGGSSLVHSSMKQASVEEMTPDMINDVEIARTSGNDRHFTQSLASMAAVYDGMQGSSPEKARIMADQVFSREFNVAELSPEMQTRLQSAIQPDPKGPARSQITYQQAIDALRSNPEFKEIRREYSSEIDRQLGQVSPQPGVAIDEQ